MWTVLPFFAAASNQPTSNGLQPNSDGLQARSAQKHLLGDLSNDLLNHGRNSCMPARLKQCNNLWAHLSIYITLPGTHQALEWNLKFCHQLHHLTQTTREFVELQGWKEFCCSCLAIVKDFCAPSSNLCLNVTPPFCSTSVTSQQSPVLPLWLAGLWAKSS